MAISQINTNSIATGAVSAGDLADGSVTAAKLAAGVGGKVLQVVSTTKTDGFSRSSTNSDFGDVTGLSAVITPTSASNKILVLVNTALSITPAGNRGGMRVTRNGTAIAIGDANSSNPRASGVGNQVGSAAALFQSVSMTLDSPATTSAVTYQVQIGNEASSSTIWINRASSGGTGIDVYSCASSITVMEIAV